MIDMGVKDVRMQNREPISNSDINIIPYITVAGCGD